MRRIDLRDIKNVALSRGAFLGRYSGTDLLNRIELPLNVFHKFS